MLYLVGGTDNAERIDVSDLFARRLAGMGLDVEYVIYRRSATAAWERTNWRGATAYVVGYSPRSGIVGAIISKLYEAMADVRVFWLIVRGDYEVLQVRDKFVVGVLGLMAARIRRIPFVYWMSYPYAEARILDAKEGRALVPWVSAVGGRIAAWLLYKVILPRSDLVIVQSQQMLRDVVAEGVPEKLLVPVPMAVSEDLLDFEPQPVDEQTILYLGTLIRVRRLDVLIDALCLVREEVGSARLVFVGDGESESDMRFLQERAVDLGLSDVIEFTGMLDMRDAHMRVARAAVCISPFYPTPLLQSTSPTKLCEYMALGRPVVANTHPEQSLIIAESGAGLCVEWSAKAFATAIVKILRDPALAARMGENGRAYVRQHRTYPVIAKYVAEHYIQLRNGAGDYESSVNQL